MAQKGLDRGPGWTDRTFELLKRELEPMSGCLVAPGSWDLRAS